jgi:hypothetical protein
VSNLDRAERVLRQTEELVKTRLACAALREEKALGAAPQVVLALARRLLASLPAHTE